MSRAYKLLLLSSLYLAQGLPFGFFTQALPVLMREAGMSLKMISATSLLFLPWALKFLWAPLIDHIGTRRQWIVPLQLTAAAGALLLSFADLENNFALVYGAVFGFNVLAAIQDVATDGLAVRLLDHRERGLGNGIQVGAYRIGMILGGGLLLYLFAKAGWGVMFGAMAAILALTCLPVLFLRAHETPAALADRPKTRALLIGWLHRLEIPGVAGFLLLVCCYKFGDSMAANLVGPMLRDHGLSKEQIALLKGTLGSIMGLAGAAAGGLVAFALGRRRALLYCGLAQTASLLPYLAVSEHIGGLPMIWTAVIGEHLLGGMATVALFTLMMDASDPDHAGTDYTLLACAVVLAQGLAYFGGAIVADAAGYSLMFGLSVVLSATGCLALVHALDSGHGPQRLRAVWAPRS